MNLFKREMRANLIAFLIWTGLTALLYFLIVVIYPSIINDQNIDEMLAMFPEELLKAFNFDLEGIATASGWLCSEGLSFYYLIGGIYACVLGSTLVLKEESDQTIEFLYTKPISKNHILISKILCGVIYITAFTLIVALANIAALAIVGDLAITKMLLLTLSPLMIFIGLFSIALLLSTLMRQTRKATIINCALVFVMYFIQIVSAISDKTASLKYFTVFTLAESRYILQNLQINPWSLLVFALLVVGTTAATFLCYRRKEFKN